MVAPYPISQELMTLNESNCDVKENTGGVYEYMTT